MKNDLSIKLYQNRGLVGAVALFLLAYLLYQALHPSGFSTRVFVQNANEVAALALVGVAQTIVVLFGGLDLSVGAVMTLVNALASELLSGSPIRIAFGILICMATGAGFGFLNGLIVVYGRIQPIIATMATGAIAMGLALIIRPTPGGSVDGDFSWAMSGSLFDFAETYGLFQDGTAPWFQIIAPIPIAVIVVAILVLGVWVPFRRTIVGRTLYAIGSAEGSAYMSGLPVEKAKILAFTLSGFFAGCAGLYLAIQTSSGNADIVQAGTYTLNSIAAVVLGGTSLLGGVGGAIGSVIGACLLRLISFYFRIFDIEPLLQPLIEGVILLSAVSLGAIHVVRVKNRLELFK